MTRCHYSWSDDPGEWVGMLEIRNIRSFQMWFFGVTRRFLHLRKHRKLQIASCSCVASLTTGNFNSKCFKLFWFYVYWPILLLLSYKLYLQFNNSNLAVNVRWWLSLLQGIRVAEGFRIFSTISTSRNDVFYHVEGLWVTPCVIVV